MGVFHALPQSYFHSHLYLYRIFRCSHCINVPADREAKINAEGRDLLILMQANNGKTEFYSSPIFCIICISYLFWLIQMPPFMYSKSTFKWFALSFKTLIRTLQDLLQSMLNITMCHSSSYRDPCFEREAQRESICATVQHVHNKSFPQCEKCKQLN